MFAAILISKLIDIGSLAAVFFFLVGFCFFVFFLVALIICYNQEMVIFGSNL